VRNDENDFKIKAEKELYARIKQENEFKLAVRQKEIDKEHQDKMDELELLKEEYKSAKEKKELDLKIAKAENDHKIELENAKLESQKEQAKLDNERKQLDAELRLSDARTRKLERESDREELIAKAKAEIDRIKAAGDAESKKIQIK
jgi:hypothetical protein